MLILLVTFIGMMSNDLTRAEVIYIPVGEQAPDKQDLKRPQRGMSQASVIDEYGLPERRTAPVGDPPIAAWHYPHYTVYFEADTVIHSVLKHTPKVPPAALE